MNKIFQYFLAGLLVYLGFVSPSLGQKRIALVIGNSNYTKLQKLPNPSNDSKLMAETLSKLGFEVVSAVDADRKVIARAVKKFGRALRTGGKDAVGLFYYAGHGVQARGTNYLVPLGTDIVDEADLEIEAISAANVLSQMEAAGNTLNLVILDACRNNPFKGKLRSVSRGLARVQAASGSLVAFAAAPGQVAADGDGANSPYTKALAEAMQVPGLTVEQMFKRVRISVEAQTGGQQTPWEESSLRGEFYFVPSKVEQKVVSQSVLSKAAQEWSAIQNSRSRGVLEAFIKRYPNSIYAEYAKTTLAEKKSAAGSDRTVMPMSKILRSIPNAAEISFWNSIQTSNNSALFKEYLNRYSKGEFAVIAKARLAELEKAKAPGERQKIANLQETTLPPTSVSPPDIRQLTFALQKQLTRVGCRPGAVDGQWGAKAQSAMGRLNKYAKLNLPTDRPTLQALNQIRQRAQRICPVKPPGASREKVKLNSDKKRFDGIWRFSKHGRCRGKPFFMLRVENGRLFARKGQLDAQGSFRFRGNRGRGRWFYGKLRGDQGTGRFENSKCFAKLRRVSKF